MNSSASQPAQDSKVAWVVLGLLIVSGVLLATYLINAPTPVHSGAPIGALRAIHTAQLIYREGDKDGDGTPNYAPSLQALINLGPQREDLLDEVLASGTKSGYVFAITSVSLTGWTANAAPAEPAVTGDRYLGANMRGQIYSSLSGPVRWNSDGSSPDSEVGH